MPASHKTHQQVETSSASRNLKTSVHQMNTQSSASRINKEQLINKPNTWQSHILNSAIISSSRSKLLATPKHNATT